ncbi:2-C-methyl-D-erythritol 4-phosphate cytidylyltransferase [Sutterella sp.]|uniref:2-C-methyl-D-erythritol 4-phosphate cytidylyltransferase n=1 Tax=Sutterella sp. TaxID=1981025 RepID=UPI0026E01C29|nr:2-C-methyl-D-erythritol 4-phosphate cytidylyltransferase [Sutterella sp.]MDO5532248.1 2-C-methyl-D-erythritol 4-phosphate cytidylyltransferase [Sutterella sp.]
MTENTQARIFALIPAAGVGRRMGGARPKQYMEIAGTPMLTQTVRAMARASRIERIYVVVSAADAWIDEVAKDFPDRVTVLRAGGAERADSVRGGLMAANLPADAWVLVHDAARPCVRPSEVNHLLDEVLADSSLAGGILAVPMADTVKRTDARRQILETVPRANLWRAATPQLFRAGVLLEALSAGSEGITDEASAVERLGLAVKCVSCRSTNLKVTEPGDEMLAGLILEEKTMPQTVAVPEIRVGQGYDSHRLVEGRPLILGGVTVPFEKGLDGHSDADVLLHALTDAVLGAASLGDIGTHFPPSDPKWKGADSRRLLAAVIELARAEGWTVVNADATIVAERPKLGKLKDEIRASVAATLGITADRVSIKAKTNERMDAVGHEEGMMAHAVVLLARLPR